jgi:hypothetical protein
MRRHLLGISIGILTFSVGVGVLYFSGLFPIVLDSHVSRDAIPPLTEGHCSISATFPGRSRLISSLKRAKVGYFPSDSFPGEYDGRDSWYGKHLRAMGETSLLDRQELVTEVYRFLWLRTFHHPVFVRIERTDNGGWITTKELGGAGGYEPGKVIRSEMTALNQRAWCEFLSLLEKADYWRLPTDDNDFGGEDGAQWILEGVKDGRYHVVDRWSPREGAYREACLHLLWHSGFEIDPLDNDLY